MTLILHYAPDNASLVIRLALEELGLPFVTRLVDRGTAQQKSATYKALNPVGQIPVLETPEGPIFETAAILLWLADRSGQLAPRPDSPERGAFLRWLFFTSNTLHPALRACFYPHKLSGPDPQAQNAVRHHLTTPNDSDPTLPQALAILDQAYASPKAPAFGVIDLYLCGLLRWCALYPQGATDWFDLSAYPALLAMTRRMEARPATRAAQKAEGLGPTPFSAPHYPNPPEGIAL